METEKNTESRGTVPAMAEMAAAGKSPEVLFWVGCAGSFDDRAKRITKAFVNLLNRAKVSFAVLGTEESCTGDPAKRAGNEFLFQMQAAIVGFQHDIIHHAGGHQYPGAQRVWGSENRHHMPALFQYP